MKYLPVMLTFFFLSACAAGPGADGGSGGKPAVDVSEEAFPDVIADNPEDAGTRQSLFDELPAPPPVGFTLSDKASSVSGVVLGDIAVVPAVSADPGIWIAAPLARVTLPVTLLDLDTGYSVEADLRPGNGAGQMSAGGYRALRLDPAEIHRIRVILR